jgi:hypothetical protein
MRGAWSAAGASACVSAPATSVPMLESDVAHAPYYTNDCLYRQATCRKHKLKLHNHPLREISRMRAVPRAWTNPHDTKNALTIEKKNESRKTQLSSCLFRIELDDPAASALRRVIAEVKQRCSFMRWVTKNVLFRAPPCFGRHVKPLVPAAFAVVSIHQLWKLLGSRGELWPVLPMCNS